MQILKAMYLFAHLNDLITTYYEALCSEGLDVAFNFAMT